MVLYYNMKRKSGSDKRTRKGKMMYTMLNKLSLNNRNSELKREALYGDEQGLDAVRLYQIKHDWDLCRKRKS